MKYHSNQRALEIVEVWLQAAYDRDLRDHVTQFWVARDILENHFKVPEKIGARAAEFITTQCKASEGQKLVVEALLSAGYAASMEAKK